MEEKAYLYALWLSDVKLEKVSGMNSFYFYNIIYDFLWIVGVYSSVRYISNLELVSVSSHFKYWKKQNRVGKV